MKKNIDEISKNLQNITFFYKLKEKRDQLGKISHNDMKCTYKSTHTGQ